MAACLSCSVQRSAGFCQKKERDWGRAIARGGRVLVVWRGTHANRMYFWVRSATRRRQRNRPQGWIGTSLPYVRYLSSEVPAGTGLEQAERLKRC